MNDREYQDAFNQYMKLRDVIDLHMGKVVACLPSMKRTRSKWDPDYIFHHLYKALEGVIPMIELIQSTKLRCEECHGVLEFYMELLDAMDNCFQSFIVIQDGEPTYHEVKHLQKNAIPFGMIHRDCCISLQDALSTTLASYKEVYDPYAKENQFISIGDDGMSITIDIQSFLQQNQECMR